jgi:hypothetical protein
MSASEKLVSELKALAIASMYFGVWIGMLGLLKKLILSEYNIEFTGLSAVLIGTLVLAKVVLILDHVPLGKWTLDKPAWVDVALRTALYSLGVVVVLLLEKGFEGRHEYGGFVASVMALFKDVDLSHVWANTICISGALLGYNILSMFSEYLGEGGIRRVLTTPMSELLDAESNETS